MSMLSKPYFHDEALAYEWLERVLWPDGPTCPHCGATDRIYTLKGKAHRIGVKKCGHCRKQFTVKVGTVFESSHVPLNKWLQAVYLLTSGKKGISSHQLHRILEVTYKTAWFMSHRIREAMRDGTLGPLGGTGATVEADETFIGRKKGVLVTNLPQTYLTACGAGATVPGLRCRHGSTGLSQHRPSGPGGTPASGPVPGRATGAEPGPSRTAGRRPPPDREHLGAAPP